MFSENKVAESCVLPNYIPVKTAKELLMNPGEKDSLRNAKFSLTTDTILIVFNKIDVLDHSFAEKWMKDFDEFDAALGQVDTYLSSLSRSMSLVLEEFYSNILSVGVSSLTQKGFDDELLRKFEKAKQEYNEIFLPEVQKKLE